ncbi:MAG: hypothetical protein ACSHX0_13440 [Akkermansiaceae bacterium]
MIIATIASFTVILLIAGGILILGALASSIEAKEIKFGIKNPTLRLISGLIGLSLISSALYLESRPIEPGTDKQNTEKALAPNKIVSQYYNYINLSKFEQSWELLSSRMKTNSNHNGNFEHYKQGWKNDHIKAISLLSNKLQDQDNADVAFCMTTLLTVTKAQNEENTSSAEQTYLIRLIFNTSKNTWLIDKITSR